MDEYERAINELKSVLLDVDQKAFLKILDPHTSDPDCRSMQSIIFHVIKAGYGYANLIRRQFGDSWNSINEIEAPVAINASIQELDKMFDYTLETVKHKWEIGLDEILQHKMKTSWGQEYDFEQLLEHGIVHILRHRRQIERFKERLE